MERSSLTILTQYYPPETGAPQNRLHSLACYLQKRGVRVNVVTAMPNYPRNEVFPQYRGRFLLTEKLDEVSVHRAWIYVSRSRSFSTRLINYFSFVITSWFQLLRIPRADYLLCESPPLFLGITAVLITKLKRIKLIFNVSDLWPESAERLGLVNNRLLLRLAYGLEGWIYRNSCIICGQTRGIVTNIRSRFPSKKVYWLPNGIDLDFVDNSGSIDWRSQWGVKSGEFVVLYAGIIGYAQGLEVILRAAAEMRNQSVRFVLAGDGPEKEKLVKIAASLKLDNVFFQPNVSRQEMAGMIRACSAFVVPLRKLDIFKGAIPSKVFEPLVLGKPILLGVEGEAFQLFIEKGKVGLAFEPENGIDLAKQVRILSENTDLVNEMGSAAKKFVVANFDRASIHERFIQYLLLISAGRTPNSINGESSK